MEEEQTRVIISKVGVLWGFWSEAEGWPTGDGAEELEVEMMRDGSWGWAMANGRASVGSEDVKHGRGNGQGCLGLREGVFRVEGDE